ncbi:hypothetical protein EON68_04150 [archaeon]|nr:MAG: hypothetical protein EON68_04150 [archaeon]
MASSNAAKSTFALDRRLPFESLLNDACPVDAVDANTAAAARALPCTAALAVVPRPALAAAAARLLDARARAALVVAPLRA